MKFEDLFKKKTPSNYVERPEEPSNYVEQSAQAVNPLEVFLAERVPKTKQQKAAEPITEEKKEVIKKAFALPKEQPVEQAPEEQTMEQVPTEQEAPQVPSEQPVQKIQIPDLSPTATEEKKKEKTLSERAEEMMPERDWTSILPYLTPMLVGALAGGSYGESYGIAGKQLLEDEANRMKRKQTLEDKLLEMDKAKLTKKESSQKRQLKSLRNRETGEPEMGSYDPVNDVMYVRGIPVDTAQYELAPGISTQEFGRRQDILTQKRKNIGDYFMQGLRTDPETGLLGMGRQGKFIPVQVSRNQLNPNQVRALDKIVTGFKTTDAYKKNLVTFQTATSVDELLRLANDTGNPSAAEFARRELAKMAEGGGKLSDQDVESVGGSKDYKDKARRFVNLQKTGRPLLAKDIKDLKEVADVLRKVSKKKLQESVMGLENSFIQSGGIPGAVQTAISPLIPGLYEKESAKDSKGDMVLVEQLDANGKGTGKFGNIPRNRLQDALKSKKFKIAK